ncbi:hypothetical protein B0T26DRAFT_741664 [Lasiosphaeria miniovina]|uniref:Zn(2)-C6 fungal-type domain-containing protein n=1 Tax=Lasiosphaeria miniovina TaxID=1954250 RepID=A0AA40ABD7_9PEZI|nr:uncharacterized protein B0T26DRAFT_741664 [Lasiosphaeria miniovina]KAK0712615.1 hypothetical protein B0T26DRAFT_741664 [Lasiosphaeria miniovina]
MEVPVAPRKTCDKCYLRRIKCDRQRLRCSNCITYATNCTYAAPSRPSRPRLKKQSPFTSASTTAPDMANLHAFVMQLQGQVAELTQRLGQNVQQQQPPVTTTPIIAPSLKTLLKLRDPVSWAAINAVLALAYKQNLTVNSGLRAVMLGDTALLNVQVLMAITVLLQASKDLKPSLILIATVLRLAHELGLHTRAAAAHLKPDIAYTLDKDLSMRTRKPSIQNDDDIDVDMPAPVPDHHHSLNPGDHPGDDADNESVGVVTTLSGNARVNYFLARIRFANIQGGIYDYLYSARAQTRSAYKRAFALESLVNALDEWRLSIPPEFGAILAPKTLSPESLSFFCVLHATSFACTTTINQAHAWNEKWLENLRNYYKQSSQGPMRENEHLQVVRSACFELNHYALRKRDETFTMELSNYSVF